jgi:hypothetical protein
LTPMPVPSFAHERIQWAWSLVRVPLQKFRA